MENKVQVSQEFVEIARSLLKASENAFPYLEDVQDMGPEGAGYKSKHLEKILSDLDFALNRAEQAFASQKDGPLGEGGNGGE